MDATLKTSLIAALRSGRYVQGRSLLKYIFNGSCRHCTLGVAYELQGAIWEVEQEDEEEIWYTPMLGDRVPEHPDGMTQDEAYIITRLNDGWDSRQHLEETLEDQASLAESLIQQFGEFCSGLNFEQMADFIEKYL